MKLVEHNLSQFINVLASNAPAPGGGSAASLEGALGAALAGMVTQLTIGKKKYVEHEELMKELSVEAEKLKNEFVELIDKDTEAFNTVSAVFEMPKETDEDKAARKEAMQKALKLSTETPFAMMNCAVSTLKLTDKMLGKSNTNAISDLGVAALSLKAAIQGAWLNVLINLSGITDDVFVTKYKFQGEVLLKEALPLADKIYNTVLENL